MTCAVVTLINYHVPHYIWIDEGMAVYFMYIYNIYI